VEESKQTFNPIVRVSVSLGTASLGVARFGRMAMGITSSIYSIYDAHALESPRSHIYVNRRKESLASLTAFILLSIFILDRKLHSDSPGR
jgi:hypothetical protein